MLPFPGGIEDPSNGSIVFSLGAALLYFLFVDAKPSLPRSGVKTLAIGLLAVLAGLQGLPLLLIAALALSALGDWFLSRDGEGAFLAGLGSFLFAHIAYIALFSMAGEGTQIVVDEPWRLAVAAAMAIFAVTMLVMLMREVGPDLRFPIFVYVCAIVLMGVAALSMRNPWVIAGAVFFMASDGILAAERFLVAAISPHRVWMRFAVWGLYYAAQALIVAGFLLR